MPAWNKTDFWPLEKSYQTLLREDSGLGGGVSASCFHQVPASADKTPPPGTQAEELSSPTWLDSAPSRLRILAKHKS